jgi:CRP-like cAMP-binding protein
MFNALGALCHSPLFKGVAAETLQSVNAAARRRSLLRKGAILSSEELSDKLYVVLSGRLKMLRHSVGGDESLQQRLGEGDVFCLVSMVAGGQCGSYGESLGPCTLLYWSQRLFVSLMEQDRQLHMNVLRLLARQVEVERHKRCLCQCANVGARVAGYLLFLKETLGDSETIDLRPMTLSAQELGMARETMSRTFSSFERAGLVDCHRGVITVRDYDRLQLIADGLEGDRSLDPVLSMMD